jgi:hypothetical protein
MARLQPYFPKSHGKPPANDRRALSSIVFVNRKGLGWGTRPALMDRTRRCTTVGTVGERGVFLRMLEGLAAQDHLDQFDPGLRRVRLYLKVYRTASILRVKREISGA